MSRLLREQAGDRPTSRANLEHGILRNVAKRGDDRAARTCIY